MAVLPETITDARVGSDHRADHVALHKRFNRDFNVIDNYGAVGDGVADDTAAINAAIVAANAAGAGIVELPPACKVTSINLLSMVAVVGSSQGGSIVTGTAGSDIFVLPTAGGNSFFFLRDITTTGGRRGLAYSAGATASFCTYVEVENVEFTATSAECVYTEGTIEEWYFDNVRLSGGTYGFRHANVGNDVGGSYVDKCTFENVLTAGQTERGWQLEALTGGTVTWINPIINTAQKDGFFVDGGFFSLVFINANTEGNGQAGKKNRTTLTGTVAAAATSATLASATGWATGDGMTIAGAGAGGVDFIIVSTADGGPGVTISGTTVSWTGGTSTAVTGAVVTNAGYDDFRFGNAIAATSSVTFIGGAVGGEAAAGRLRYGVNLTGATGSTLLGLRSAAAIPVYDPTMSLTMLGCQAELRVSDTFTVTAGKPFVVAPDVAPWTSIPSPKGKSILLWLRDSNGDSTGTFANFSVYKYNSNRNEILRLSGTTGTLLTYGGVGPGSPTGGLVGQRMFYGSAAPGSGTFAQGDIVFNTAPAAGGIPGWVCTTGGTPGTWKAMAALAA